MQKIRRQNLGIANELVQVTSKKAKEAGGLTSLDSLEKAMSIQSHVQSMREWPIPFSGMITLIVTVATATGQILISILGLLKP